MIARTSIALFVLILGIETGFAQCGSIPNVLVNGQPADANQVMANFNFLRDCVNNAPPTIDDTTRRNILLDTALLAKLNAGYIRNINVFADGYKSTDGISSVSGSSCSGLSSGCTVSIINGYVMPTPGTGGIDPYTIIMLHMDGPSGNTGFPDASSQGNTWTATNVAVHQTSYTTPKFGTAAARFNSGTIRTPDKPALRFGTGDFTIDFWIYYPTINPGRIVYDKGYTNPGGIILQTSNADGSKLEVLCGGSSIAVETSGTATGTWIHKAIVRTGTTVILFSGGNPNGSGTCSTNLNDTAQLGIGSRASTSNLNQLIAQVDELRVSNVARWTSAFTPPTAAYSTSDPSNMTLVTTPQNADTVVGNGRVLLEYNSVDPITLNTDLAVDVTCNGGSSWTAATLSAAGTAQAGHQVAETADTTCGTSGTSFAARIKSMNAKNMQIFKTTLTVH